MNYYNLSITFYYYKTANIAGKSWRRELHKAANLTRTVNNEATQASCSHLAFLCGM